MGYIAGCLAIAFFMLIPSSTPADPSVYPLGTTIYMPEKCWNGFTILSTEEGRLIDMNGNLAHLWKGKLHHPNKVYPGGYLLVSTSAWKHGRQDAIQIQLRDFNDNVVWEYISSYAWDSSIPSIRNLVYRAYRNPYGWVPQLPKPKEAAVELGPNYLFTIPAKYGSRPDFGIGRTGIWTQGTDK